MKIKTGLFFALLSSFLGLFVYATAFAGWGDKGYGNYGGHMMGGTGYMGWFMIIFWGLILIALIFLIRWISHLPLGKGSGLRSDREPLDILKERLARGEIEIDEYREKKQLLS